MAIPLDTANKSLFKTPYEAMLEHEVATLKRKLAAYSDYRDSMSYPPITAFPANEVIIDRNTPTLQLAVLGGYKVGENEAYHVWAKEQAQTVNRHQFGYYISDEALLTRSDRASILQSALEKATFALIAMIER